MGDEVVCVCVCVCVLWEVNIGKQTLGRFWSLFLQIFFKYSFRPLPFLLFWDAHGAYVGMLDDFPQVFEILSSFIHSFFFFCSSDCISKSKKSRH